MNNRSWNTGPKKEGQKKRYIKEGTEQQGRNRNKTEIHTYNIIQRQQNNRKKKKSFKKVFTNNYYYVIIYLQQEIITVKK